MVSPILIITAIESGFGALLTGTVLTLVLLRGRKPYHYVFAAFLLICVIWDAGVFALMIRNQHVQEMELIGRIAITPCILIPALVFHFANLYTGRPLRWAVALIWVATAGLVALVVAGVIYRIEGHHTYTWGNMFRVAPSVADPLMFVIWFGINLWACGLLFRGERRAESPVERRHYAYVIAGLLTITFAVVKALVTMGVDAAVLLPLGMFLSDVFVSVIGVAIIKDRLFDITVIVKKGTMYSVLAAAILFVFSFSEHLLITYAGRLIGGSSEMASLISIAIAIAVLLPLKRRLEHGIDSYFAQRKLAF